MKPGWLAFAVVAAAYGALRRREHGRVWVAALGVVVAGSVAYGLGAFRLPDLEQVIEDLGRSLGAWTYLLVGALAFAETGAFIGLIAPGESAILVGGLVAGQGRISIVALIAIVWVAAVAGDFTSFFLGRRLGRAFMERHGEKVAITAERLASVEAFFAKHGGKAIFLGRFVGLVRAIAPFLAGSGDMRLRRFAPYDVLGAGIWGTTYCLLGYVFWQSFGQLLDYAKKGAFGVGFTIALVYAIVWLRDPEHRAQVQRRVRAEAERSDARGAAVRGLLAAARPLARPARFAWHRLTPGDLGLELTTLLAVLAVGVFAVVGYAVAIHPGAFPAGDLGALRRADEVRTAGVTDVSRALTWLGASWVTWPLAVLAGVGLVARREVLEGLAILGGMALTEVALLLVQHAEDRPRPGGGLVHVTTSSFPSGHTAHATVWVAVAVAVARVLPGRVAETLVVTLAAGVVVLVGLTRLELRVHYLSDVVAGAGLGAAAFAAAAITALVVGFVRKTPGAP